MTRKKTKEETADRKEIFIPETIPVVPVRNMVFFPKQVLPISIGREMSMLALAESHQAGSPILILTQVDPDSAEPGENDLYHVGTVANVLKIFTMPDGTRSAVIQGIARARVMTFLQMTPFIKAVAQRIPDELVEGIEVDALVTTVKNVFRQVVELSHDLTEEQLMLIINMDSPADITDSVASMVHVPVKEKQSALETLNVKARLELITRILGALMQRLELGSKIQSDVQEELNKSQREYILREQMKAIQKELGEQSDMPEIGEFRKRMNDAKLPDDVRKTLEKEIDRLSRMHTSSAEYMVARTYIEWLLDLPWIASTTDAIDINKAKNVLDHDHYGLDRVKNRILEYLAVRKLKNDMRGPILCFVGPPGVGKTSLGKSIANALGRKFVRMSLGGVHDEAEIRGHRRTYIGALPGRIIQGIKRAGSNNPVFILDEIDKVGMDFRGDPASALLEVLDPEQNATFSDHYVELAFDLSKVLFIATANMLDTIPPPLRDRMEIIQIPSYVEREKLFIAREFLLPKQKREHGILDYPVAITDDAITEIISGYTREAGVRSLERGLADVCRGVAKEIAEGKTEPITVTEENLRKYLGRQRFFPEIAERINKSGIATGLAWTPVGGDILFIEATKMKGKGNLVLTGQLGDVMKESARAALSYIASNAARWNLNESFKDDIDIHIHIPAGAIPKDGPSAGVTMLTALLSVLTGRVVRNDLAMTGEITLRGAVLPVGGIKEKVLAAHRAGIRTLILPDKNRNDIEDIPGEIAETLTFHYAKEMDEVLELALQPFTGTQTEGPRSKHLYENPIHPN